MNRLVAACVFGLLGSLSTACAVSGVGDPCTPEEEFATNSGASSVDELVIDLNSTQCDTRICLRHYFQGRVTCPFGNGKTSGQTGVDGDGAVTQICTNDPNTPARRFVFRLVPFELDNKGVRKPIWSDDAPLCCPIQGNADQAPIPLPVSAQCKNRPAEDSVYCTCRCDVPSVDDKGNKVDKSKYSLCSCPSGFKCTNICDESHGSCAIVGFGKWGSYCVKNGQETINNGEANATSALSACGEALPVPTADSTASPVTK